MTTPAKPAAPLSAYLPPQPRFGACPACGAWCLLGPGDTLRTPLLGLPHHCAPEQSDAPPEEGPWKKK